MSVEQNKASLPERIVYKGGEVLGLVGGVWYLLNANIPGAIAGAAVAFVSHLIGSKRS